MSNSIEPAVAVREEPEAGTVGLLHLAAERRHARPFILRRRVAAAWQDTPDWRFHRHVMRIGLYLRERGELNTGDRVALLSRIRPEWAIAQWGALTMGAPTATLDPDLSDVDLAAHLKALAPRALFVEGAALGRVLACRAAVPTLTTIVALDGDANAGATVTWSEALDLGGSLDTAERANTYRARTRALVPETPALGSATGTNGSVSWRFLSHHDVVHRVQRVWARARIASGDVAYVAGEAPSLATNVALLAFAADGYTQIVIGTRGTELEEIAMTTPHKIIASAETVRRLLESTPPAAPSRARRWLAARAPFLGARLRGPRGVPEVLVKRARWLSTGPSLAFATRANARKFVTLEIDDALTGDD
jgi:acyl-CoA synthetase (AMP-forming)/AMP-acid ligase II